MAYCKNCGAPIEPDSKFCTNCGATFDGAAAAPRTSDFTAEFDAADIKENRFLALYCYLGMLMLIPLVAKPNSAFIKFHANQGLILTTLLLCLAVICIVPILGWLVAAVGAVFSLVCVILGIVNSCCGRAVELPLIGRLRIIK